MEQDLNKLVNSISQLPKAEQNKILTFLLYQSSSLTQDEKETIEFLTSSSEKIKKWLDSTDSLLEENKKFFSDITKTI